MERGGVGSVSVCFRSKEFRGPKNERGGGGGEGRFPSFLPPLPALYSRHFSRGRSFLRNRTGTIRLLPIVLALFLALFGFESIFFLHLIPKSTDSIILDFQLIICMILC